MDSTRGHQPEPVAAPPGGALERAPEAAAPAAPGASVPAPGASPPWADRLAAAAASGHAWLMRPRVRLSVSGVLLLLIGVLLMANSVWTLPLVIVGALMVVVAWIGHRLEGRFTVQWGQTGTELAFRATIKPAMDPTAAPPRSSSTADELVRAHAAADIIDGEAHTVEIDVAELKALIAAAESAEAEAQAAPSDAAGPDIRIRRVVHAGVGASDASR